MWIWVWVLLVIGSLVCAGLLGWWLWQRMRAAMAEIGASGEQLAAVTDSLQERIDARTAAGPSTAPTVGDDPVDLLMRVEQLREERLDRIRLRRRDRSALHRFWMDIYR